MVYQYVVEEREASFNTFGHEFPPRLAWALASLDQGDDSYYVITNDTNNGGKFGCQSPIATLASKFVKRGDACGVEGLLMIDEVQRQWLGGEIVMVQ